MKPIFRGTAFGFVALLCALVFSSAANAGCGDILQKHKASWSAGPTGRTGLLNLASDVAERPSIVGMWSVKLNIGSTPYDFGYSVWHSDGTEFLNSGTRPPATQNFCLGVWKQIGWFTYKLSHWALSYDLTGKLNANVNIRELVNLDRGGNTFNGVFTIDVYDPATGTHLGPQVAGQITGSRVTVDN